MTDRRVDPRLSGVSLPIAHATLRPARSVHVVDLSQTGVQIQTDRPLRPCSRVHVRFRAAGESIGLAAVVLRCAVYTIRPFGGVSYRAALVFDERCPAFWEEPVLAPESPERQGK